MAGLAVALPPSPPSYGVVLIPPSQHEAPVVGMAAIESLKLSEIGAFDSCHVRTHSPGAFQELLHPKDAPSLGNRFAGTDPVFSECGRGLASPILQMATPHETSRIGAASCLPGAQPRQFIESICATGP